MLEPSDIKTFKFNNIIVFQTCTLKYLEYIPVIFQVASLLAAPIHPSHIVRYAPGDLLPCRHDAS
ncbi:hypothetical protein C5472_11160 [Photorhabdus sp. RW14-46]|nr:hypothetical protein PluDJC_04415 [Photorhabdus laumondii subsp. laumondii]NHB61659.1 hypothetical protein [Photorhabdus sp. RW14-46]RAW64633.1 hypothetical protein CKY15_22785 [Photorhabdus sp. S7-51]RAW65986.1 hypothetical protein CKY14_22845 [Photorhabdus sp. S14-60]RAW71147.1 hypothetical protein CKY06_22885 [Photorhabdus sp. S15-56]RAW77835.1 hypothetical protein CKY09_23880 [Photorhabdus sp. S5P8-50]